MEKTAIGQNISSKGNFIDLVLVQTEKASDMASPFIAEAPRWSELGNGDIVEVENEEYDFHERCIVIASDTYVEGDSKHWMMYRAIGQTTHYIVKGVWKYIEVGN